MTERDALIAAVLADPAGDLPRLVFADWCDDHGEPDRAEFVRVQVALARLGPDDPARGPLEDREDELLDAGHDRWKVTGIRGVQGFVRGFVELWDGTADWLLSAAGRLFEQAPVRAVRVRNADHRVPALCRLAGLAQVEALDVSGNTLAAHGKLERLLTEAPLGRLRSLNVGNNRLFADALPQIAGSPVATQLSALDLSGNPLGDEGLVALAELRHFRGLSTLLVRNNEQTYEDSIQDEGVSRFAHFAAFRNLTRLDLTGHHCYDGGFVALLDSPVAQRLDTLQLGRNHVGEFDNTWAHELTRADRGRVPRVIDLSGRGTTVGPPSAAALAQWSRFADGVTIDLRGCTLLGRAYDTLAASPYCGTQLLIDSRPPAEDSP